MFGKNSAGKSTVVQAIHYAREIFERNNLNADRTLLGGTSIDLGGFRQLVNNYDPKKAIKMRFEMDLRESAFPDYYFGDHIQYKTSLYAKNAEDPFIYGSDLSSLIESTSVEIKIEWSSLLERPVITEYKTWLNEIESSKITTSLDGKSIQLEFNSYHPLINASEASDAQDTAWETFEIYGYNKSVPEKGIPIIIVEGEHEEPGLIDDLSITQMLVAPADLLRERLASFRYIGPLRATPSRNYQPSLTENESDWANGLAAWRELYNDKSLAEFWVSGEWLLKSGYRFELNQYREIPVESDLMEALENNNAFGKIEDTAIELKKYPIKKKLVLVEEKSGLKIMPHDIGVGISQVIPVVVRVLKKLCKRQE